MTSEDFVLQKFSAEEQSQLPNLNKEVNAILSEYLYGSQFPHDTEALLFSFSHNWLQFSRSFKGAG